MNNKKLTALVMALLIVGAMAWNPPINSVNQEIKGGSSPESVTVFNISGTRIKPSFATEALTNSVTLNGSISITESPKIHSKSYWIIGVFENLLKILREIGNQVLTFLTSSLSLSINRSITSKKSMPSPYLGSSIVFIAVALTILSYYLLVVRKRKSARLLTRIKRGKVIQKKQRPARREGDLVTEAINALAAEASKDLRKPPEAVTHRECRVVAHKVSKEDVKKEIMELIMDYELSKFAGKSVNKDLHNLALKVINAIRRV